MTLFCQRQSSQRCCSRRWSRWPFRCMNRLHRRSRALEIQSSRSALSAAAAVMITGTHRRLADGRHTANAASILPKSVTNADCRWRCSGSIGGIPAISAVCVIFCRHPRAVFGHPWLNPMRICTKASRACRWAPPRTPSAPPLRGTGLSEGLCSLERRCCAGSSSLLGCFISTDPQWWVENADLNPFLMQQPSCIKKRDIIT